MRRFGGISSTLFASLVLPACGGGSDELPDAPRVPDGAPMVDAGPDAQVTGPVTLTAYTRCCDDPAGTRLAGVQALVIRTDGTTGDVGTTDGNGEVTLDGVEPGAGIAAIYTSEFDFSVVAFVGVQPGDQLVVGDRYYTTGVTGTNGQMTVSFPTVAGAYATYAFHPCGSSATFTPGATSLTIDLYDFCQTPTASVEMIVYDINFNVLQAAVLRDISYTPGTALAVAAWEAPIGFTIDATGLGSAVEYADLYGYGVIDGVYGLGPVGAYGLTPDAGAVSAGLTLGTDPDRITANAVTFRSGYGNHVGMAAVSATATSAAIADPGLPWIAKVSATSSEASWSQDPGTVPGDGAIGFASWQRFDPSTKIVTNYDWTIVLPPGITAWSYPQGPSELEPYRPAVDDFVEADAMIVDLDGAADYNALRGLPEWVLTCPQCAADGGDLTGGHAAYSYDGGEGFAPRAPWRVSRRPR